MGRRHLSSEEQALWMALTQTVRPLRPKRLPTPMPPVATTPVQPTVVKPAKAAKRLTSPPVPTISAPPARSPAAVLDSGWERRIRGGQLTPDMSIDLHGHTLATAHARLNQALAAAWARDVRVMLVVTGKPPRATSGGESRRGAIRGEIGHWLETGSHADRIASVRIAHPRHGGDGALYVILRRKK